MRALLAIGALVLAIGGVALWLAVREPAAPHLHDAPAVHAARPAADASPIVAVVDATTVEAPLPDMLTTLRASGSANEVWAAQGMAVLDAVEAAGRSDLGCFVAGCGGTFTFASQDEYTRRRATVEASAAYTAWTGGKRWTDVEHLRDGRVRVALLLYRPD